MIGEIEDVSEMRIDGIRRVRSGMEPCSLNRFCG